MKGKNNAEVSPAKASFRYVGQGKRIRMQSGRPDGRCLPCCYGMCEIIPETPEQDDTGLYMQLTVPKGNISVLSNLR